MVTNKFRIFKVFIVMIVLLFVLCSCSKKNKNQPVENDIYYNITFQNYDGTTLQTTSVKAGDVPSYNSTTPTRESDDNFYYTFASWSPSIAPASSNQVYVATYTQSAIKYYRITFQNYDGTILQTSNIKSGVLPSYNKSNPTRSNDENYTYMFSGWSPSIEVVSEDKVYTATYIETLLPYKVTIDLDGGTSNTTLLQFRTDLVTKDQLPFDVKKRGYAFKGYSLNGIKVYDEDGKLVNSFQPTADMTFIAIFEESVTLTVTYSLYNPKTNQLIETYTEKPTNIGNVSETRSYKYNTYVDLFAEVNEGYTFVGWYNDGQVLSNSTDYKYMMWDEDFTIEARFKYTKYNLNIWSNNSDLGKVMIRDGNSQAFYSNQTLSEYYTEDVTIVAYSSTNTQRFLGWYDENNKLVSPNAAYTFKMSNHNYSLEAKWDYFKVIYDLDGGVNNVDNPRYYNVDMENITLKTPTKEGYTFYGWEYNDEIITQINTQNICHMNLKALWIYYTLTTNSSDDIAGSVDTLYNNTKITAGNIVTIRAINNPGYIFNGWYDGVNIINTDAEFTFMMPAENITYIALWALDPNTPYKVEHYQENLGINDENIAEFALAYATYYGKEENFMADGFAQWSNFMERPCSTSDWHYDDFFKDNPEWQFFLDYYTEAIANTKRSNGEYWTYDVTSRFAWRQAFQAFALKYEWGSWPYSPDFSNFNTLSYTLFETDNLHGTTNTLTNGTAKTYEGFTSPTITQVNIDGNGETVIKLYYTRNTYQVILNKNIDSAGSVIGDGTYKYGQEVTITANINPGYIFNGWYIDDELYSIEPEYTFTIETKTFDFVAKYTANKYAITINNYTEGVEISGIESGTEYDCGSTIILEIENASPDYTFTWQRSDGVSHEGSRYEFTVPATNITIIITMKPYIESEGSIYFGMYPQSLVDDEELVNELNDLAETKPIETDKYKWIDYNYYISGSVTSFMYYQDIDYDDNGTYDYRGVYFTQYRPYYAGNSSSIDDTYQYDNEYFIDTIYWFAYEPIKWDILVESGGKAFLIANLILDSQDFYSKSVQYTITHNGGLGYANNYELSSIRKFLNYDFYNIAFNELQKSLIDNTSIDNSVSSTGQTSNNYICDDTTDKIFLLSYEEVTTFSKTVLDTTATGTDYAKSQGIRVYDSSGKCSWLLRSPGNENAYDVVIVDYLGYFYVRYVTSTCYGVRPACWINLV